MNKNEAKTNLLFKRTDEDWKLLQDDPLGIFEDDDEFNNVLKSFKPVPCEVKSDKYKDDDKIVKIQYDVAFEDIPKLIELKRSESILDMEQHEKALELINKLML